MLIPVIGMWVFADRKFDSQDTAGHLYFQDVESYQRIRCRLQLMLQLHPSQIHTGINHFFEYERALDVLLEMRFVAQVDLGLEFGAKDRLLVPAFVSRMHSMMSLPLPSMTATEIVAW